MAKQFPAKYRGVCVVCGVHFEPGEMITRYEDGWGHSTCPTLEEVARREARDRDYLRSLWERERERGETLQGFLDRFAMLDEERVGPDSDDLVAAVEHEVRRRIGERPDTPAERREWRRRRREVLPQVWREAHQFVRDEVRRMLEM